MKFKLYCNVHQWQKCHADFRENQSIVSELKTGDTYRRSYDIISLFSFYLKGKVGQQVFEELQVILYCTEQVMYQTLV
jgi:hypothetical protein